MLLGGLALAAAAGVVVTLTLRSRPAVEIAGLWPGEILFLDGLEVDPLTLKPRPAAPPVVVAVAVEGVLKRMGTASVGTVLDLQPLFEAAPAEGQTARLSVKTRDPGCKVEIDGAATASKTPVSITIAAGKVMTLAVNCEGKPAWTGKVLGVTGQLLEIAADESPPVMP